jgi:Domain of unknown function (DUF1929)/FG-GAP repeat
MARRHWRVSALAGLLGLIMSFGVGVNLAAAHPDDENQKDTEHAKEDLANTSIEQIEKETAAQAAKIEKETGNKPGRRNKDQNVPNATLSAAAAQDPGQGGKWSSVLPTSVVPIFQAVLPNGKVLIWDSVGQDAPEQMPDNTFTRAMVWDPQTNTSVRKDVSGYNIFCAGYTQLADGNVLVAGGNKNTALDGIVQTHIFNWQTETWKPGPDMAAARWYPAVQALGNDEAVIVGGGPTVPEVYQTDGKLRRLSNASGYSDRLYAFLTTRPDGKVELMGPPTQMNTINTSGTGAITATTARDTINRTYGGFATYDKGKVLVAGGGDVTEGTQPHVPTKTARIVDVNGGGNPTVTDAGSMSVGRRQHNLTILADGSVLATGGMSKATNANVDLNNPVFAAERWVPPTGTGPGTWTVLSGASRVRQYHSSATLLPDGRVLTGGGGVCASCVSAGYLEKNVEYFEPPYLFKKDTSGDPASRPVIDNAPGSAIYGQDFTIDSPQAGSIAKVGLVRLGAATHSQDQGQRYVPLSFKPPSSTITATAPANSNIAPAGYYMLFIIDNAGVPSVAKMIKIQQKPAVKGVSSDFNGDRSSDAVIADPYADPGGVSDAGQVTVLYGTSSTIGGGSVDTLMQGSANVGNTASSGDRFGTTVSAADLDNDGYTDLLVGTPYEDINGQADSGLAQVIWGSPNGLGKGKASTELTQTSFGRTITAGDQLGYAIDASNELGADLPMVAVGVPGGNVSGLNDAGWVGFFTAGLNDPRAIDQDSAGIPGAAEASDRFGEAITLGLIAGTSTRVDAAVGTPGEDLGSGTSAITNAGAFTVINDLYTGAAAAQAYDQNSSGVPGTPENNDGFGQVLDSVRAGSTTHLAVGIPSEAIGTAAKAGSVQLFTSTGTTITPGTGLTQDTTGVTGTATAGDQFGRRIVLAPPGLSDTKTRLALSAPYKDSGATDAGQVQIFPLDDLGAEVTHDQTSTGVGTPAANDHFGEGLGFVAGATERVVLVGVPDDVQYSSGVVSVIPLLSGTPRSWRPATGGVPTTGADRFGGAAGGEVQQ